MLAGAGCYIPEEAGKRSKYMQGGRGEASYHTSPRCPAQQMAAFL